VRRLSAILAADVAGYSRLMGADEVGTLAALTAHRRELIDPAVAEHAGRIVKTTGDGLLVEFASVVDAVQCAVEIQRGMAERNEAVPQDRRLAFRIGLNLGDVIVQDGELYGDGINVAARLEALAEPGGIYLSASAHEQVQDKIAAVRFEDLGEQRVKNIARPVRVYRVTLGPAGSVPSTAPTLPNRPSIAVLPLDNLSADPEQEYFADGLTEDLITDLSKIAGLLVIARNSTFTYKGHSVNVAQVGRELGVRYVVEGSVRKAGNRVRITAQLIDAATGAHVWADRYDRDLTDIFAVQDEVTREIVGALRLRLTPDERRRVAARGTDNLEAYDLFLRGRELAWLHTREAGAQGSGLLRRALDLDPTFAAAAAVLGFQYTTDYVNRWSDDPDRSLRQARELAERAVALDPSEPQAHFALGATAIWLRRHDEAIAAAERAVALDPNLAAGHSLLGVVLHYAGRSAEAFEPLERAMRLDPHHPGDSLYFFAQAHFALGDYDQAAARLKERLVHNPTSDVTHVLLAACYGHLGRIEEAQAAWRGALRANPDYSFEHRRKILPYKYPADLGRMVDGLRAAGVVDADC
jgi:adenylate cyclase